MKYKVITPISIGERREAGEIVDINKETAARYSEELEKVEEAPKEAKKSIKLTKKFLKDNPELAAKFLAEGYKEGDTVEAEEAPKEAN